MSLEDILPKGSKVSFQMRESKLSFAVSEDQLCAQGLLNSIVVQARDAEAKMIEAFIEKHGVMPVIRRWFDDEAMSLKTELIAPH